MYADLVAFGRDSCFLLLALSVRVTALTRRRRPVNMQVYIVGTYTVRSRRMQLAPAAARTYVLQPAVRLQS